MKDSTIFKIDMLTAYLFFNWSYFSVAPCCSRKEVCVLWYRTSTFLMFYLFFHLCFSPIHLLQYRENCIAAKSLFSSFCLPPECLQTELLPYLAVLANPMRNQGKRDQGNSWSWSVFAVETYWQIS